MKLAILYSAGVHFDGRLYSTDAYQHYQFAHLRPHFDAVDLVVPLDRHGVEKGSEQMNLDRINVLGLPYFSNGFQVFVSRLFRWVPALIRVLWTNRRKWDLVLLYDLSVINQVAALICMVLRIKFVLLVAGRHADTIRRAHAKDGALFRAAVWAYSCWAGALEDILVRRVPTLANFVPKGLQKSEDRTRGRLRIYVGSMVEAKQVRTSVRVREEPQPVVLSVARVIPVKGFEHMIEALSNLRRRDYEFRLRIVGPLYGEQYDGYEYRLRQLIERNELADEIEFVGSLPFGAELMEQYADADIFAMSSLSEGIPKVLCEAMAMGLPIVATRVGGVPWFLESSGAGMLVEPGDSVQLADALGRLLESADLRRSLGEKSLAAAGEYTAEVQMKRVAEFMIKSHSDPPVKTGRPQWK